MAEVSMNKEIYDSQARGKVFADTFKAFWDYRELILLLVKRDIAVRYKRSLLGLLWTLLNPLLTSLVLWFVFINIFRAKLRELGADVSWHDELVGAFDGEKSRKLEAVDLGIIATAHSGVDYSPWKNSQSMVIDLSTTSNTGWQKFL